MINNVTLVGRLTKDPELRTTGSGNYVAMFTLAVERNYVDQQGNRKADFINCVLWRKAAETFCNYTSKGSLVGIVGSIQTRNYDDKDGKKVFVTEVLVSEFTFLESRKERENRTNNSSNGESNSSQPMQTQKEPIDPFTNTNGQVDISGDDLPF
ncbi:single-stranded DNA-binding protein [Lactobacillus sp. PV037]|uniref:single-stranded DNA-binding protein n=1 Tax=Lactobacillus sp. PV037 TaxID=2594496 RepID=UPI002240E026|nr:single-stranded DNA-binding protein [Lactobacillus sp. PV037]QNQ83781.1 single-stranded DNA-binding protein [Lactobacillus sp. PV037]